MNQSIFDTPYTSVLNSIGEAIFIHDPETGLIHDVNDTMLEMYGYSKKSEIVGRTVKDISAVNEGFTLDIANQKIKSALTGAVELFEWKAKRKDHSTFWVEVSLKLSKFDGLDWLIAVVRDISDKKNNELKVQQIMKFHKILAELSTHFISLPLNQFDNSINNALKLLGDNFKCDRTYIFSYNRTFTKMSNTHEWCNQNIQSFKNELQNIPIEKFQWHHNQLFSGDSIVIPDVNLMSNDSLDEKKEFQNEGIQSLLIVPFVHDEKIIGFIGVDFVKTKHNFTDEDEIALKAFGNIIGQALVRQKYEIQLKNAKQKAEESDKLKTAFLANMSHEIRTPMNGIVGFTEILAEYNLSSNEQHEYIQIINESSKQLLSIINNIIDISKIESKQVVINNERFNLKLELDSIILFFTQQAKHKNLHLKSEYHFHSNTIITTDRVKLTQILTNLISNALKYTAKGSVLLVAKIISSNLEITVADTGVGISKKNQYIIFDRFSRVNDKYVNSVGGTGLGLAITKGYIDKLGGKIKVISHKNIGSQFIFNLPIKKNE